VIVVAILIGCIAVVLLLPTISDLASLARLASSRRPSTPPATPGQRLLVLIPAHNEELLIGDCVRSVLANQLPASQVMVAVIADNCTDRTAAIVRAAGAICLERTDPVLPGKPRALAWALTQIEYRDYDSVVIIDADTVVGAGLLEQLAAIPDLRGKSVQAYHGVLNTRDNALTRMATVFAEARYSFEFPLKRAAGLNVPLMGNGMCIGTDVLAERGWTAFSICEDWELYGQLTERGVRIEGAALARLYSQEARSLKQSASQRRRWAAGKITVLSRLALPLLRSRKISMRQKLDVLAELLSVGPAVHLGLVVALIAICQLLSMPGGALLTVLLAVPVIRLGIYALAAVPRVDQPGRALMSFLYLPFYAVWRCGLQISALRMLGDKPWVKTERHA
jgi:cellulose synthase/poly-beta-1,6-N-acetylglucosamine synthase-like glycosyltransferase